MLRHYHAASRAAVVVAAATAAADAAADAAATAAPSDHSHRHNNPHLHRDSSALAPDAGWAPKESRDVLPAVGQVRPMSARILAVGVMLVGVLVLSVALIMGLEFPKFVHNQLLEDQCVVHQEHPKWLQWVDGSQWTRQVRLYFQHLINKEQFLYYGAVPQFEERGPYVYHEYEIREDVEYLAPEVQYRIKRLHVFDLTQTQDGCSTCSENDNITVVNTDYLKHVYQTGGLVNYLLSRFAATMQTLLSRRGFYGPSKQTINANISSLGCLQSCDSLDAVVDANVSFGRWLRTSLTAGKSYASAIMNRTTSFNSTEMAVLYGALANSSSFGSGVFSSLSLAAWWHERCRSWASYLCGLTKTLASVADFDSSPCGLVHFLLTCDAGHLVKHPYAKGNFTSFFCAVPSPSEGCLILSSLPDDMLSAYFEAFKDFVLIHLLGVIHDCVVTRRDQDVVVTRSQKDLALGYYVTDVDQSAVHVQGVLDEEWLKSSTKSGCLWVVETCLLDQSMDSNMRVKEFNESQHVPPWLLRDSVVSGTVDLAGGYTAFFPACRPVTCSKCASPGPDLQVFQPLLQRNLRFTQTQVVSLWDTDVYRYNLSKEEFRFSKQYQVSCGLQRASGALGFTGWISLPKLDNDLLQNTSMAESNCSSLPAVESYIDVEALSGRMWQSRTQFQLNAGIRNDDVTGPIWRPLNVRYLDKAVPLVWTDRLLQLAQSEREYYHSKVDRLMKVSCGGLIALSIVAVIVIGIGVGILIHPKKSNRVTPQLDPETSASNAQLSIRHHNNT